MTETEWLACRNPMTMLEFLRGKASDRKCWLFACACCRRVWHLLIDPRCRQTVEVGERYADGLEPHDRLSEAKEESLCRRTDLTPGGAEEAAAMVAAFAVIDPAYADNTTVTPPVTSAGYSSQEVVELVARFSSEDEAGGQKIAEEQLAHIALLRDIFGNPFRPSPSLPPAVLKWNDATVRRIAEGIYEERRLPEGTLDRARLAILSDALLDAGCDNEELIAHCRIPGPHVRGCWAIDQILEKT